MRDKKAVKLLGEHVVNLIVAVLCIIILVYLGLQIYNIYLRGAQKLEQAKYTLEMLKGVIDEVKNEEEGYEIEKEILNPKGWYLISYGKGEESPSSCGGEECLCICEKYTAGGCGKKGACEKTGISLKVHGSCYGKANCLYIEEIFTLFILKGKDFINLKTTESLIGETNLKEILEYKKDESSKTTQELVSDYLKASDSEKLEIREQIKTSLESFFAKMDTEKLFELKKENFAWVFEVSEISTKELELKISTSDYAEFTIDKILASNELTFEEKYIIKSTYYKGTRKIGGESFGP